MSLSRIVSHVYNPHDEKKNVDKTVVIVGTVTDDTRYVLLTKAIECEFANSRSQSPRSAQDEHCRPPLHSYCPRPHHQGWRRVSDHRRARHALPNRFEHCPPSRTKECPRGRQALWIRPPLAQEAVHTPEGTEIRKGSWQETVKRLQGLNSWSALWSLHSGVASG